MPSIASLLTCTRASSGYYQNADGTLQQFGANVLRYGTNGLLVEEARTNLALRSQAFSVSPWADPGGGTTTVTDNVFVAPDGTTTASRFVEAGVNNGRFQSITLLASTTYTMSVYVKNITTMSDFRFGSDATIWGGNNTCFTDFNLVTGVVTANSAGVVSSSITALANGWYRLSVTGTTQVGGVAGALICYTFAIGTIGIWGAQIEAGAFATSYIPTTTVSVTRAADAIVANGITWLSQKVGTFYELLRWSMTYTGSGTDLSGFGADLTTNRTGDVIDFYRDTDTSLLSIVRALGVTQYSDAFTVSSVVNNDVKMAIGYYLTNTVAVVKGVVGATPASNVSIPTVDEVQLGKDSWAPGYMNGYIKRFTYYNTRLSNANMQQITT